MAWFTGFPVNAVKSTSARLEDLCKTESKNISETPDLSVPRLPPFPNMLTIPDTTPLERSKVFWSLTLIGTHAGSKRRFAYDFTLAISTGIVWEAISLKSGTRSRLVIEKSIATVKFIDWWLKMSIAVIEIIDRYGWDYRLLIEILDRHSPKSDWIL